MENGIYVGGHGTIRYTITIPMALSFLVFGENEISMALPTLLYGAGIVLLIGSMACRDVGPRAATVIVSVIVTNPILVVWSSIASVDIIEAFFVFSSLYFFHWATSAGVTWPRLLAAGAMAAFGFLTRETTFFLLLFYGVLCATGWGIPRLRFLIMAAGFLGIWVIEVLYLTVMTGDPLYRINIALHHDSSIDRSVDLAGNFTLNPLVDPLLVLLVNQEFVLLFWMAIPCGLWLLARKRQSGEYGSYIVLFGGLALCWFVSVAAAHNLLPLNPRYFLVSAIGASVVAGLAIYNVIQRSGVKWGGLLLLLLVGGNLAGIYVENRNYMFGERALAEVARHAKEPIFTDPMTFHRAKLLLRWDRTLGQVLGEPPVPGSLYLYNPGRAESANPLMQRDVMLQFHPQPDWTLEQQLDPEPKFAAAIVDLLGLDLILPDKIVNALGPGHPGVRVYRLPRPE
jgi:4-amino-4-deoxy-L-arabinose transferase-like glycosyltransferase